MLKSIDVWASDFSNRKWMVAPFSNFYGMIWVGFYIWLTQQDTFFLEVSF